MSSNTRFDISTNDLGDVTSGLDRLGVDQAFTMNHLHTASICLVCNYNKPKYKMIPKHKRLNTAEIQDRGYICEHCVSIQAINPTEYRLKELY